MTELWLLRHAKAVQQAGGEDRDRALAEKGEEAMRAIAAWAAEQKLAPALVLSSSAARTRQTLSLLLPALGGRPAIKLEDGLYLAPADRLLTRLKRVPQRIESALVVGHNPGLHELAMLLMASGPGTSARQLAAGMPTGALAGFAFSGAWAVLEPGAARLAHYVTPKDLRT